MKIITLASKSYLVHVNFKLFLFPIHFINIKTPFNITVMYVRPLLLKKIQLSRPIEKVLIANRGEIACRVASTAKKMGLSTVSIFTTEDHKSSHIQSSNEAYIIGSCQKTSNYMNIHSIVNIAKKSGSDAVHPGYGYLSENAEFAREVEKAGLKFLGPTSEVIQLMGNKQKCNKLVKSLGVPILPGYHGEKQDLNTLTEASEKIGLPLMIKPALGGGGRGIRIVRRKDELSEQLYRVKREAKALFYSSSIILERYIQRYRHIEVQVVRDEHGNAFHFFERECTIQRRNQKVIEEAPAQISELMARKMRKAALKIIKYVKYTGVGTVEYILDEEKQKFYFLEVNTRIQVEHPVTEQIIKVARDPLDIVKVQVLIAMGTPLPFKQGDITVQGHSIEGRLYAEDPVKNFEPTSGRALYIDWGNTIQKGDTIRIDTALRDGDLIEADHDPMIAKVISNGPSRKEAIRSLRNALGGIAVVGVQTNKNFLKECLSIASFQSGYYFSDFIEFYRQELLNTEKICLSKQHVTAFAGYIVQSYFNPSTEGIMRSLVGFRVNSRKFDHVEFYFPDVSKSAAYCISKTNRSHGTWPSCQTETYFEVHYAEKTSPGCEATNIKPPLITICMQHNGTKRIPSPGDIRAYSIDAMIDNSERILLKCFVIMSANEEKFFILHPDRTVVRLEKRQIHPKENTLGVLESARTNAVTSPIQGRVAKCITSQGTQVLEGELIMTLHAMKMEHEIHSTKAGRVNFRVEEGHVVTPNQVIATIET